TEAPRSRPRRLEARVAIQPVSALQAKRKPTRRDESRDRGEPAKGALRGAQPWKKSGLRGKSYEDLVQWSFGTMSCPLRALGGGKLGTRWHAPCCVFCP